MVELKVNRLETGYSAEPVLKEIDMTVAEGDFVGVIGPNGCGKSTLLRAITGVLPAWDGEVYLDDKWIQQMSRTDISKIMAVVPQRTQISFPFTVREVVEMGRTPYLGRFEAPDGDHADIVSTSMERVGVKNLQDRTVRELSGGEYQRMLIARSLAQEPDLLLMDEATSHLDIGHRIEVMDLIKRLNREENLTVISIHHDLDLAARYCEEIILMDRGRIRAYGKPMDVLTPPHLRAVYGIEAEVRRNRRDGTLYIVPIGDEENISPRDMGVHVICGGGTGTGVMKRLVNEGYRVSTGVLNAMDTDLETAGFLDVRSIVEAPFSPISESKMAESLEIIDEMDAVVMTPFPIGPGNLKNLELALCCAEKGKRVFVMDGKPMEERDHTGGEGTNLYRRILDHQCVSSVRNDKEVLIILDELCGK